VTPFLAYWHITRVTKAQFISSKFIVEILLLLLAPLSSELHLWRSIYRYLLCGGRTKRHQTCLWA